MRSFVTTMQLLMVATVGSMKLRITGQTPAVSEPLRAYADLKIGKPLARYAEMLRTDVELNLKVRRSNVAAAPLPRHRAKPIRSPLPAPSPPGLMSAKSYICPPHT